MDGSGAQGPTPGTAPGTARRVLAAVAGGDGTGRTVRPRGRAELVAHRVFWTLYVVASAVLAFVPPAEEDGAPAAVLLLSALLLALLWFGVLRYRERIRRSLRWLPLPHLAVYLLVGVPLTVLTVACGTGFGLAGDDGWRLTLARELGPWLVLLGLLWWARRRYALTPAGVFWLVGGLGALVARDFALPVAVWHANWLTALLLFGSAVPVYGGGLALTLHAMPPEQLPAGEQRLGRRGGLLAAAAVLVAFTLLALGWSALVGALS